MNALHVITTNLGDNVDSLKLEDLKEMLSFTKMYYNNRSAFRAQVIAQDWDHAKGRNHLIKTVRNGNVAWAKRIIHVLDTLDSFTLESSQFMGKECYICYEPFEENHIVYKVPCKGNHIFHKSCIDRWVGINSTCPYCRDEINLDNITGFLNKQSGTGKTVLYYAIKLGNQAFVEELLEKGALVGYNDAQPIHLAAGFSHQELLSYFLAKGMSIECLDGVGRTPLYYASRYGDESIVRYLLENGAKFKFKFYDEDCDERCESNALLICLAYSNKKAKTYLIDYVKAHPDIATLNDEDSKKKTALFHAVRMYDLDTVVGLIEAGADLKKHIDDARHHPLWAAVSTPERMTTIFYYLLEKMVELFVLTPEEPQFLCLLSDVLVEACMCHKLQFVKRLLISFNLEIDSACYLYLGAREGSASQKVFDELKSIPNYQKLLGNPEFFLECVRQNNVQTAESCLITKNQKEFIDNLGNSAVHYAKSLEMLELLDQYEFDFTLKNKNGCTAIHTMIGDVRPPSLVNTLTFPLSPNEEECDDDEEEFVRPAPPPTRTPIRRRVVPVRRVLPEPDEEEDDEPPVPRPKKVISVTKRRYSKEDSLQLLIKKGVDINALNNEGLSALQYVAINENKDDFLLILLNNGADVNECSKYMSPLHIAMVKFHQSFNKHNEKKLLNIIRILIERGADVKRFYDDVTAAHFIMNYYYLFDKDHLPKILKNIHENGGDLNAYDVKQRTPFSLILESQKFNFSHMEELEYMTKDGGLNLNTLANFGGNTLEYPLHWAVSKTTSLCTGNWYSRLPEMMKYGADPSLVDPAGKVALDYAPNQEVKNLLLRHLGRESEVVEEIAVEAAEEEAFIVIPVGDVTQQEAENFIDSLNEIELDDSEEETHILRVGRVNGELRIVGRQD